MSNKLKSSIIWSVLITITFSLTGFKSFAQKPILIEFGWDYPDVDELNKRLDSIQNTPFDGICFSYKRRIMEAFDTMAYLESHFEFDKLPALKWGKYTENYSILRGYSKTGGNWFDDNAWKNITTNMNNLSRAIAIGKLKGILFDAEYYLSNPLFDPWTYSKKQYPSHSFEEVQNQVRDRGRQFITALQKHTVNFNFLSIWLTSLLVEDLKLGPLENARHVMLLPFFEGILLGKDPKVKIIDGNEYAYWNIKPSQFLDSKDYLRKNTIDLLRSPEAKKLATNIETSQPVYYDGLLARHPDYDKGVDSAARWKWLEENLKLAMATSTSNIVWFYNERVDWWRGNKVNDTLVSILENCKSGFSSAKANKVAAEKKLIQPKSYNVNTGNAYYYFIDSRKPMKTGTVAFTYTCNPKDKTVKFKFADKLPLSVSIYINNTQLSTFTPKAIDETFKVSSFKNGRLAVLAKYEGYLEAFGLSNYQL